MKEIHVYFEELSTIFVMQELVFMWNNSHPIPDHEGLPICQKQGIV